MHRRSQAARTYSLPICWRSLPPKRRVGRLRLMNADLVVRPNATLAARVRALRPGELFFSRRIDIDQPDQTDGMPWRYGYDFFAGHADDISRLSDTGMAFGAPLVGSLLPAFDAHAGLPVMHLKHTERWSWPVWEALGQRFVSGDQG